MIGRTIHARGSRGGGAWALPGSPGANPASFAVASRSSSESEGSKSTASSRVVGPGSWGALSADEGEEPYVPRPLVDLAGLGGSSRAFAVRDMLRRGRATERVLAPGVEFLF